MGGYNFKQQEFLDFVLKQYVKEGVGELANEKLPTLLEVKYSVISDAAASLGSIPEIRDVFIGFQQHLYARQGLV
jgi:type I restriction enzyme R subunit